MPFDPAALCYGSVREHYRDDPTEQQPRDIKATEEGFNARTASRRGGRSGWTQHPCRVALSHFHSLSSCFPEPAVQRLLTAEADQIPASRTVQRCIVTQGPDERAERRSRSVHSARRVSIS
ncbi:hypothetical protein EYF80_056457 [Liparis tanakae]|uniref:Uncharacterized protein n=1 Tax=Liparis tanakae TaxID=230148 RepID=A0A4Z2EX34_9TELE|nr:hypothetical protein EYF80_056457 [Liparis tanakae]